MKNTLSTENLEEIPVDAELMSAWLGDVGETMSPRLLFDLKALLCHYADFLVPNKDIVVEYPIEGFPRADVGKNTVFIPVNSLEEGRVDHTISSFIHELHHIKYSISSQQIILELAYYIHQLLSSVRVKIGEKENSIWQVINNKKEVDLVKFAIDEDYKHPEIEFLRDIISDIFFLVNVIEDVRIDEKQPKNLQKYRNKHEKWCFEKYLDNPQSRGEYYDTLFETLFHYKGFQHSDSIDQRGLSKDFVVGSTATSYYKPMLKAFADVLQKQVAVRWNEKEENKSDSVIEQFLDQQYVNQNSGQADETESFFDQEPLNADEVGYVPQKTVNPQEFIEDYRSMFGKNKKGISESLSAEIASFEYIQIEHCKETLPSCPEGVEYDSLIIDCYV
jgi:hypothetical protein